MNNGLWSSNRTRFQTAGIIWIVILIRSMIFYWVLSLIGDLIVIRMWNILQSIRKGLGGLILKNLIEQESGRVLLEIDPVTDKVSAARLHFYQLHGFVENPYPHTHPAYRNGYPDHSLVVLSSGETIPDIEYKRFASDLNRVIMKKGR